MVKEDMIVLFDSIVVQKYYFMRSDILFLF